MIDAIKNNRGAIMGFAILWIVINHLAFLRL